MNEYLIGLMDKGFWTTVVFALEEYVNKLNENGEHPTPHIYNTLSVATVTLGNIEHLEQIKNEMNAEIQMTLKEIMK